MNIINVQEAAKLLQMGELIVVPTDTVYGIAADSKNPVAVDNLFKLKERPQQKPFILLISSVEMLADLTDEITDKHKLLIKNFWPGPLTILFKKSKAVSNLITADLPTVGIRIPSQKQTLSIIKTLGHPIVATSVNKSGGKSLNNLNLISSQFPYLDIVDGEESVLGLESTVIDVRNDQAYLIRLGSLTVEEIEKVLGERVVKPV